jgi:hypothetical protein
MATTTTIPSRLYVTIQYRKDASTESGLLGFASPYEKNAAFQKRKVTQDSWAYGSGANVTIDDEDNVIVSGEGRRGGYGGAGTWDATMLFMAKCYPIIIDNVPVEGFQIAKSVRRYGGWGGSGNVLWRLADPRGFELEIGSENFARIVDCTTIVNGVIQGKCVWGREAGKNLLLPESSEPYQAAAALTAKVNTKVSLKDVQIGDTVDLLISGEERTKYQYLGKYFLLQRDELDHANSDRVTWYTFNKLQTERYIFKSTDDGSYMAVSTPKVSAILEKIATPLNKVDIAKELTAYISKYDQNILNSGNTVLVSATKIKLEDIYLTLDPVTEKFGEKWPGQSSYSVDKIFVKDAAGVMWMSGVYRNSNNNGYDSIMSKVNIELTGDCAVKPITIYTKSTGYSYYGRGLHSPVTLPVTNTDILDKYRLIVHYGDLAGTVTRLGYY